VQAAPARGSTAARPRVVIVRGHQANPWELAPWQEPAIAERFAVSYLRSRRGWFDTSALSLDSEPAWTARDLLPPGPLGDLAVRVPGERYLRLAPHLRGADIVHSQELGYWYSMQAARLKRRLGFKLALTVWETLPFLGAYRNVRTRPYRELVLAETDLFLAATARARASLLLEGAPAERIRICPPGIDVGRFGAGGAPADGPPTIISAGRLVWEKGHQDVLRALALLRREGRHERAAEASLLIVGRGPEERRLRSYAQELGIAEQVEFRGFLPYEEMPGVYAGAACLVLASLPTRNWEEQFGMVLAEAMAAGVPIVASSSGAIPEVTDGRARLFAPGDWVGLAELLAATLEGRGAARERAETFSTAAAAAGIAAAYEELLGHSEPRAQAAEPRV
jgi:glycosyltransferase involved in cell wall biosynthesis